jgi:hypothetical protein
MLKENPVKSEFNLPVIISGPKARRLTQPGLKSIPRQSLVKRWKSNREKALISAAVET